MCQPHFPDIRILCKLCRFCKGHMLIFLCLSFLTILSIHALTYEKI